MRPIIQVEDDYKTIIKSISKDGFMKKVIGQNYGMRLRKHNP
jgi:hypothetical protein